MTKIVNGVVVKESSSSESTDNQRSSSEGNGGLVLFGRSIPWWMVAAGAIVLFFCFGFKGLMFGLMGVGAASFASRSSMATAMPTQVRCSCDRMK